MIFYINIFFFLDTGMEKNEHIMTRDEILKEALLNGN
jgi:hypothetical protein